MENTNIVTAEQQAPNTISASNSIFNVQALGQLQSFAGLMAQSVVTVPAHLAGKPADCMAIVMQAMQWGMNPYAVAQKTHLVNGQLGYEAQLVNAVITSSSAIHGRFHYRYGGDWERCTRTKEVTREKTGKNGKYTVTERVRDWTDEDEAGLYIEVGATELKNKAVKRYYQVDAQNKVEAVINSLPNPGEPESATMFAKAESTLSAAKRHLGDELYDQFRITLDDMKPEYVG
ncbi:recombinase RecT [Citrobacter koseri]|nr:recombinase RecT [Citrobacter koseri]HDQ2585841.1 recombinase RecT [Citrobacter koseri]